jgi:hypothetical protein
VTKIYLSNLKPNGMEQRYKGRPHSGNFFSAKENFEELKIFNFNNIFGTFSVHGSI